MPSLSFDPVAHAYDATRGYPSGIAEQIAQTLAKTAKATAQTTFLEVGIGTGRIAFPLASLGHIYTGVDISEKMVEQLEAKLSEHGWQEHMDPWGTLPDEDATRTAEVHRFVQSEQHASMRLVMADMTKLPFVDASFDVAVAVHVFHLVDGWQQAVSEVVRVVRPGGLFLHCWDEYLESNPIEARWREIIRALGAEVNRPGASSRADVTQYLRDRGLQSEELHVAQWERAVTPRQAVEQVTKRLWSGTWGIPDDIFEESAQRLWNWANSALGEQIDTPRQVVRRFVISKTVVE